MTPNQIQLITALRSGKYTQTTTCLHDEIGSCILGVAAREFMTSDTRVVKLGNDWAYNDETVFAPDYVIEALGLFTARGGSSNPCLPSLTGLNDDGKTFLEIADILEANPKDYFHKKPTQSSVGGY
jgi:hypothetical protein